MKFLLNSWFSISVLITLILFIPYEVSFLTFKPFDFWLFAVLIYNANKIILPKGNLVKILLSISFLSVLSTSLQASKDSLIFDFVFFSHFYRYFRLILIITVVKLLVTDAYSISEVIKSFYVIGSVTILISIIQILDIAPISIFFNNLFVDKELISSLTGYGIVERFGGIMGNPNAMGILLCSFGGIAITKLTYSKSRIYSRVFSVIYFISILIIVAVFTSSRTSVLILLILISIVFLSIGFRKSFYVAMFSLISLIFISSIFNYDVYENLYRLIYLMEFKTIEGDEASFVELTGRNFLWQDRLDVFFTKGHNLVLFFGMGFTKIYYDYSDNGLLTFFINFGLLGLMLKIVLYILILKLLYYFYKRDTDFIKMSVGLILISLFLFEFSSETFDHIKLGPIFFLFLQMGLQIKEKSII